MATYGFNFRSTSGFVTDGANQVYVLYGDGYPTTRGGVTFGWQANPDGIADRNSGIDPRLAGIHAMGSNSTMTFQIDVTGSVKVRLALGDASSAQGHFTCTVSDSGGSKFASGTLTPGAAQWYDAGFTLRTSASDWVSNNAQSSAYTFAGYVQVDVTHSGSDSGVIAHVEVEEQGGLSATAGFVSSASQAYDVSASPGAVGATAGFVSSGSQAYDVGASPGAIGASAGSVSSSSAAYDVSASPGAVSATAGFVLSASQAYDVDGANAGAQSATAGFVASASQAHNVTASPGAASATAGFVSASSAAYDVSAASTFHATAGFVSSASQAYTTTASPGAVSVTCSFIASASAAYSVTTTGGASSIVRAYIADGVLTRLVSRQSVASPTISRNGISTTRLDRVGVLT